MSQVPLRQGHVALGANLATSTRTPIETLTCALELFEGESLKVLARSAWYQTPAFPAGAGPDFVNGVVKIESALMPQDIISALHRIESEMGRQRLNRWEARVCDLDLVEFAGCVLPDEQVFRDWMALPMEAQSSETPPSLILPHPRMQDRSFVLVPMAEISPDWRHPVTGLSVSQMLEALPDHDRRGVQKILTESDTRKVP